MDVIERIPIRRTLDLEADIAREEGCSGIGRHLYFAGDHGQQTRPEFLALLSLVYLSRICRFLTAGSSNRTSSDIRKY